jgi:hypothetical protein
MEAHWPSGIIISDSRSNRVLQKIYCLFLLNKFMERLQKIILLLSIGLIFIFIIALNIHIKSEKSSLNNDIGGSNQSNGTIEVTNWAYSSMFSSTRDNFNVTVKNIGSNSLMGRLIYKIYDNLSLVQGISESEPFDISPEQTQIIKLNLSNIPYRRSDIVLWSLNASPDTITLTGKKGMTMSIPPPF